ncbi:MAG: PorT family protein [Bacteroidetes bacterium]|nr:PorT family protein [Bacteroidota bacterium]
MKKVFFALGGILVAHAGFSQITIDPEVGLNFTNQRTVIGSNDAINPDATVSYSAGVGVNIPLTASGLYVKPGVSYQKLGGEVKAEGIKTTTNLHYLSVPVNLGYRYQIGEKAGALFAEAGPYAGLAIAGNTKIANGESGKVTNDISFGSATNEVNRFDWGFNFGLGYETPWGVYVKGGYGLGLGNLSNVNDQTVNNRNWNLGLGYRIKL